MARTHRIVLVLGDDLGDFLGGAKPRVPAGPSLPPAVLRARARDFQDERRARVHEFDSYWGQRWFMLPNPMYGSWLETFEAATAGDG